MGIWVGVTLAVAAVAALAWAVLRSQELPRGVEPVAWEREMCAQCHMHIGDPRFAAQLQTKDGRILHFDDPGCLVLYEATERPAVHAIYFHHLREDRWLAVDEVGFVPGQSTPMGYGFGAVDRGTPEAIPYAELRERLLRRRDGGS
jgi:hypothetical protein